MMHFTLGAGRFVDFEPLGISLSDFIALCVLLERQYALCRELRGGIFICQIFVIFCQNTVVRNVYVVSKLIWCMYVSDFGKLVSQ